MTARLVQEILEIYRRHGWEAESALLTERTLADIGGASGDLFGGLPVRSAPIDAIWFQRPSKKGRTAVELRLLTAEPFAFFELIEEGADEERVSAVKKEMERKASERASKASGTVTDH